MRDSDGHATRLGRLLVNLQSLEFLLRAYLYAQAAAPHVPLAIGSSLDSLQVGEEVGENALTDYSSLGQLIDRYNASIAATHPHLVVDRSIVDVRDALAHGRVSASGPNGPFTLLKFEKPTRHATRVAFCVELTKPWLKEQVRRVYEEVHKVAQAPGSPAVI